MSEPDSRRDESTSDCAAGLSTLPASAAGRHERLTITDVELFCVCLPLKQGILSAAAADDFNLHRRGDRGPGRNPPHGRRPGLRGRGAAAPGGAAGVRRQRAGLQHEPAGPTGADGSGRLGSASLLLVPSHSDVARLYAKLDRRRDAELKAPTNPFLYVPAALPRDLDKDLVKAGVPKHAPGGKLDFHAIRLAYINLVLEFGVSAKEAQALARHSTPDLTFNLYGRTRGLWRHLP